MILSCGEALIDMLPRQTAAGEAVFLPCGGGAAFNTAIALGRLGVPVGLLAGLSSDMFGDVLRREMAASGAGFDLSISSDRPTTLAFVKLVDGAAEYGFIDENTAGRMISAAELPNIPAPVHALLFGGISLVAEPCGATFESLMAQQSGRCVIMIDPNIRPGFIDNESTYRARLNRMIGMADIVKLSDEDLRWLYGAGDIDRLAADILALGPHVVFLSKGAEGACAYTDDLKLHAHAEPATLVDTVGAGDTFNGGLLAALYQAGALTKTGIQHLDQGTIVAALELGTRTAAISVSRAGANPPWSYEL
ncbi:MAG: carbohydrate kinase [Paracoccaceae bacterium]